jgi:hypothetical protein
MLKRLFGEDYTEHVLQHLLFDLVAGQEGWGRETTR